MGNLFQKALYILSNFVPFFGGYFLLNLFLKKWIIAGLAFIIMIFFWVLFMWSFTHLVKQLSVWPIQIDSVESRDGWVISFMVGQIFPWIIKAFWQYNAAFIFLWFLVLLIISIKILTNTPNVLLLFHGYHFYKVSIKESGINDYLLITKRKIRNRNKIRYTKRIFERVLIDKET